MSDLVGRLIKTVNWLNDNPMAALNSADMAAQGLLSRGMDVETFILEGAKINPFIAVMEIRRLRQIGKIDADYENRLYEKLQEQSQAYLQNLSGEDACITLLDIGTNDFTRLCCALHMLPQKDMLVDLLTQIADIEWSNEQIMSFSRGIYHQLSITEPVSYVLASFYDVCYRIFPIKFNESFAYNQGFFLPVETVPPVLHDLLWKAFENRHMLYVNHVLKVFPNITLRKLNMKMEELLHFVFTTYSDNYYRGMRVGEKLCMVEGPSPVEGLDEWWRQVEAYPEKNNPEWEKMKGFFKLTYVCQRVELAPRNAGEFLRSHPVIPYTEFRIKKINHFIQSATEQLLFAEEPLVFEFLRVIGDNNIYAFNSEEELVPYFEINTQYSISSAIDHLIELGYDKKQLIEIYMNTYLRSCYSLPFLLQRILFIDSTVPKQKDDCFYVGDLFEEYTIRSNFVRNQKAFSFVPTNICSTKLYMNLFRSEYLKNKNYYDNELKDGEVYFGKIEYVSKSNFLPRFSLDFEQKEFASFHHQSAKQSDENIQKLFTLLECVREDGVLTTELNTEISSLYIRKLEDFEIRRLNLLILEICTSLAENHQSLRYFINMLNRLGNEGRINICRFQYGRHYASSFLLEQEDMELAVAYWDRMNRQKLEREECLFVYLNTCFKYFVPISEWVGLYYDPDRPIVTLSDVINAYSTYWFSGKVMSVVRAEKGGIFVNVNPLDLCAGAYRNSISFVFKTVSPKERYVVNDICYFQISAYNFKSRTVFISGLTHRNDLRVASPASVFLSAMNRSSYSLELDFQTRMDLSETVVRLTETEKVQMLPMFLDALYFRRESKELIWEYLDLLSSNNPWREDADLCEHNLQNVYRKYAGRSKTFVKRCMDQFGVEEALKIVQSTPIKEILTEEEISLLAIMV